MSFASALKAYNSLNGEQKSVLRDKKISASHTPAEWIAMLGALARYDREGDSSRKVAGWGIAIGIIGALVGGIVTGSLVVLGIFLIITIASILLYRSLKSADLSNSLREFVLPLLALMREDMNPDAPLHLTVSFKRSLAEENQKSSRKLPGGRDITQNMYKNGWMEGEGVLADGSTLGWSIVDLIRERKITKRNPRGKLKMKTKYKVRRIIDMRVGLRREDYTLEGAKGTIDGRVARVNVKEGEKRNVLKVRRVIETSSVDPTLDVKDFIDPLAAAFRRASLTNPEGR
jgi:hypothetical protein